MEFVHVKGFVAVARRACASSMMREAQARSWGGGSERSVTSLLGKRREPPARGNNKKNDVFLTFEFMKHVGIHH